MKYFLAIATMLILNMGLFAQGGQFTKAEDPDPETKAILDKVRNKYKSYSSLEASFTLEIEVPEQPRDIQKGTLAQQGDKYKLEFPSQTIISNGAYIWLILEKNKEVQINDVPDEDEDDSILSPQTMLTFYDKGDFVYLLVNEFMEGKRAVQQIEFKPLDEYSDYSKLRLTVDKKTADVVRIKAFAKDGARYTIKIDKLTPNKIFAPSHFTFDKSKYPGFYIEDLRE